MFYKWSSTSMARGNTDTLNGFVTTLEAPRHGKAVDTTRRNT